MAVVAEGSRRRLYLSPSAEHEATASEAVPTWEPEGELPNNVRDFKTPNYGLSTFASLFTPRQLVALTTFSDLLDEARERALADARTAGLAEDLTPLHGGGLGAIAYADAAVTYLGFALSRSVDRGSSICSWDSSPKMEALRNTFARQALPMTWDFAEGNPFSRSSGSFTFNVDWVADVLGRSPASSPACISSLDASRTSFSVRPIVISTDPPYYDNIGYAELSDFFYVWLRRSLFQVWPELFRRLTTPKDQELVATPYRHGGKDKAEAFFIEGMSDALRAMRDAATDGEPLAIYYAFKQSEASEEGVTSAGWASFLQAVVDVGLVVDGTWPIRTELANRLIGKDANALSSSVVLVCRKRDADAALVTRAEFMRVLKRDMPDAIDVIRKAGVGPVDMQQSVIGPGMSVFTRYEKVLESDDSPMSVRTALSLINRVWEEIENELDANFDPETQVALAWFANYGFDVKPSGELTTLANAKNIPDRALFGSGVFENFHGKTALTKRADLAEDWSPATDRVATVWECVQHTARVLKAPDGGGEAAARLVAQMGAKAADVQKLAYRLFEISTQKGWSQEALIYNELAQEWAHLEDLAVDMKTARPTEAAPQRAFDFGGSAV